MSQLFFGSSVQTGLSTAALGTGIRPSIDAEVEIGGETYERALDLASPADVASIDPSVWSVRYPEDGSLDAETTFMPSITLEPADLPWRLSRSTTPVAPWIGLIVIPEVDGVTLARSEGTSVGTLILAPDSAPSTLLPNPADAHRTAHLQAGAPVDSTSVAAMTARLVSLTPLLPETHYLAAVVPLTAEGVAAALGKDVSGISASGPAWDLADPDLDTNGIQLPAFTSWRFATGPEGDFASLTRRIQGSRLTPGTGLAPMEVSSSGSMLPIWEDDRPVLVDYEGAMGALDNKPRTWNTTHRRLVQPPLEEMLNESIDRPTVPEDAPSNYDPLRHDPIVAPPLYGELNAGLEKVPGGSHWARTLNLNPQWRAAAGVGARAVRARQSDHLAAAWRQLQDALEAMAATNRAQLAATVGQRVGAKISAASDEVVIAAVAKLGDGVLPVDGFSDPVMVRSLRPATAAGRAFSSAVDRAVRINAEAPTVIEANSAGRTVRAASRSDKDFPVTANYATFRGMSGALVDSAAVGNVDDAKVDPTFHQDVAKFGLAQAVQQRLRKTKFGLQFTAHLGDFEFERLRDTDFVRPAPGSMTARTMRSSTGGMEVDRALDPASGPRADFPLDSLGGATAVDAALHARAMLDPSAAVVRALTDRVNSPHIQSGAVAPQPVSVQLRYDNPFINEVLAIDQRFVIPGLNAFTENTMALAAVNTSHIAAILAGANDELMRELLWNGVPVDPVQTPIRKYWPSARDDVEAMADWSGSLGKLATSASELSIVIIRAELFARYPDARVVAVPAKLDGTTLSALDDSTAPVFEGWLDRSTRYVAFDLTADELIGRLGTSDAADVPGFFVAFEESSTSTRFRTASIGAGSATRVAVETYAPPFRGLIHASELAN